MGAPKLASNKDRASLADRRMCASSQADHSGAPGADFCSARVQCQPDHHRQNSAERNHYREHEVKWKLELGIRNVNENQCADDRGDYSAKSEDTKALNLCLKNEQCNGHEDQGYPGEIYREHVEAVKGKNDGQSSDDARNDSSGMLKLEIDA